MFGSTSKAITLAWGTSSGKQLQSFRHQIEVETADARQVSARAGETGDQAVRHRVGAD
jgi:hypothetical protein